MVHTGGTAARRLSQSCRSIRRYRTHPSPSSRRLFFNCRYVIYPMSEQLGACIALLGMLVTGIAYSSIVGASGMSLNTSGRLLQLVGLSRAISGS